MKDYVKGFEVLTLRKSMDVFIGYQFGFNNVTRGATSIMRILIERCLDFDQDIFFVTL